jgi:predicted RNase H-like HicB family nuclease
MAVDYTVIVERDAEGWFVASVPELRCCHTQARSLDELHIWVREAIEPGNSSRRC